MPLSDELREQVRLTDEEIIGDFCKTCDYILEGCLEHGQQSTCVSYQEALRQKTMVADAQLTKAYPIIRAETLKEVGGWSDTMCSDPVHLQNTLIAARPRFICPVCISILKQGRLP